MCNYSEPYNKDRNVTKVAHVYKTFSETQNDTRSEHGSQEWEESFFIW